MGTAESQHEVERVGLEYRSDRCFSLSKWGWEGELLLSSVAQVNDYTHTISVLYVSFRRRHSCQSPPLSPLDNALVITWGRKKSTSTVFTVSARSKHSRVEDMPLNVRIQ